MKNLQKGFVTPLIIAIIALLAVGGGAYIYVNKKPATISPINIPKTTENVSATTTLSNSVVIATTTNKSATTTKTPTVNKVSLPVQGSNIIGSLTPKETFIKFRTEFDATKTFDEALAVSIKYATKEKATFFRNQSAQVTEAMKAQLFPSLKSMMPPISTIVIISENITGNTATLSLKTNGTSGIVTTQTGTVTLEKESDTWKIKEELWK